MAEFRSNFDSLLIYHALILILLNILFIYLEKELDGILIMNLILLFISYWSLATQSNNFKIFTNRLEIYNNLKLINKKFPYEDVKEIVIRYNRIVPVLEIYLKNNDYHKFPFSGIDLEELFDAINQYDVPTKTHYNSSYKI